MLISSAHAQAASGLSGALSGEGLMGMLPIILMFALLYFLMIRPLAENKRKSGRTSPLGERGLSTDR